jgi:glycosyltransferase involved in cell wall biosynthesis
VRVAVIENAPFGGLLHYAVQLADALAEQGDDVDLIVPAGNELAGRDGTARRCAVLPRGLPPVGAGESRGRLVRRRARSALARLSGAATMVRTVRRGGYDVVVLNGSIDLWLSALAAFALIGLSGGARVVHVCHNVRPFNRWSGDDLFLSSPLTLALLRRLYPRFDLVFVHGERSRDEFGRTWPGTRLAVIPHGDERIFCDEAPPPAPEPRALFFGDWRRVKGLPVLMRAFDELAARWPDVRLTVAGAPAPEEGEADAVLRWAAERAERVEVIPRYVRLDEVPGLFGRARVVVAPYLVGYQSGVVHLAMTMGRAVIATNVGDLGSAVLDGETGRLVAPGDAAGLAVAMEELLRDPARAERLGAAGRARVLRASGWPMVARRARAALAELVGSAAG